MRIIYTKYTIGRGDIYKTLNKKLKLEKNNKINRSILEVYIRAISLLIHLN